METQSRLNRRTFLLGGAVFLGLIGGTCSPAGLVHEPFQEETEIVRPAVLGTTVSRLQCEYLGLDYLSTIQKALDFGFDRLRIPFYWSHLEPEKDQYDFQEIEQVYSLIGAVNARRKLAQNKPITITQTVGASQPRFPEFHFPPYILREFGMELWEGNKVIDSREFLAERNLLQIAVATKIAAAQEFITDIQVENEAITGLASASGLRLSVPYFLNAIQVVRENKRPDQQISLNFPVYLSPASTTEDEQIIESALPHTDIIGLDVYTIVPNDRGSYDRASELFWAKLDRIKHKIARAGKILRISELQCEPWEKQMQAVILDKFEGFNSSSPELSAKLISFMARKGFDQIDTWGFEWWEYLAQKGYPHWKQEMFQIA